MSYNTIPVTFNRSATYTEELRAEVDPHEYVTWCADHGWDADNLESLRDYMLLGYNGDIEESEGNYEDSEFRDFDNADYAKILTAAAEKPVQVRPDDQLRDIAMEQARLYGVARLGVANVLVHQYELTATEQGRIRELLDEVQLTFA